MDHFQRRTGVAPDGRRFVPAILLALAIAAGTAATPLTAESLGGREIAVQVFTFDDPTAPDLVSHSYSATIGPGPEFGLGPEGRAEFLDIVPVELDIDDRGVSFDYRIVDHPGDFAPAEFNGYVLTISPCAAIVEPKLVSVAGIALDPSRIRSDENELFVNVEGLSYTPETRFRIGFGVVECPVS